MFRYVVFLSLVGMSVGQYEVALNVSSSSSVGQVLVDSVRQYVGVELSESSVKCVLMSYQQFGDK